MPYTKAGCNVGEIATANQELENPTSDIPKVFGANSPEAQQTAADPDSFKDNETADYVGLGVHCARGAAFCADAQAVKYRQTTPSPTAVADLLPDEPGGYSGFQALFGSRYIAPQLGAGTPSLSQDGVPVTNAAGNLTDEFGNQINGDFTSPAGPASLASARSTRLSHWRTRRTCWRTASRSSTCTSLTSTATWVLPNSPQVPTMGTDCASQPSALGSGTQCYIDQGQYYNDAFGAFFQRLAADGITPHNTLFILSSDEGDHEAGANVGRAVAPSPAGCDGVTVPCTYTAANFGEISVNATGLLASETGNTTPFSMENDTAPEFYLTGNPGPTGQWCDNSSTTWRA